MRAKLSLSGSVKECQHQLIVSILSTKALTNYHVRNGRAQNSLLSSLLCSAIHGLRTPNEVKEI